MRAKLFEVCIRMKIAPYKLNAQRRRVNIARPPPFIACPLDMWLINSATRRARDRTLNRHDLVAFPLSQLLLPDL